MLLLAKKEIPGTIQIVPGQKFIEQDPEQAQRWVDSGHAEWAESKVTGWPGIRWQVCEVLIMASGPSLNAEQIAAAQRWREASDKRRVMVINTTFQVVQWADILYACDARWWAVYYEEVLRCFRGELWSQTENARPLDFPKVKLVNSQRSAGLNRSFGVINTGNHSGYQAINLAWQSGARKMLLLGYDMKDGKDGKTHHHGEHPNPIKAKNPYNIWKSQYRQLAEDLATDSEVINLTTDSALRAFPMAKWEEALA